MENKLIKMWDDATFEMEQNRLKEILRSKADENGVIKTNYCAYHFHKKINEKEARKYLKPCGDCYNMKITNPKETKQEKKRRILWEIYTKLLRASQGCG